MGACHPCPRRSPRLISRRASCSSRPRRSIERFPPTSSTASTPPRRWVSARSQRVWRQRARRASGRRARARVSSARHSLSLRVRSLCCARPVRSHHVFYCAYSVRSYQVRARIAMIEKLNVPDIQAQYELILKQMVRREKKRMKAERPALDVDKIEYKWGFHACAAEVRLTTVTPLSHSHHSPITTAHHPCHHPPQPPQPHHHSPPSMLPPPRQIPCTDPPPASSCVTALHPHVPYRSPPPPTSRDAA